MKKSFSDGLMPLSSGRKPRLTPNFRPASPDGSDSSSIASGRSSSSASLEQDGASPFTTIMHRLTPFSCSCGQKARTRCAYSVSYTHLRAHETEADL
eukprot:3818353-Rhodomonas_salina.1